LGGKANHHDHLEDQTVCTLGCWGWDLDKSAQDPNWISRKLIEEKERRKCQEVRGVTTLLLRETKKTAREGGGVRKGSSPG